MRSHSEKAIDDASVRDLENARLNCVRGEAASAISALLWEHPNWFESLRLAIEHLVKDPHPAVRIAAIEACLAALQINKDLVVEWFCWACEGDLRVAASHRAVYLFNGTIDSHFDLLSPIVRAMLKSPFEEVAKEGASEVTARWLFHGMFALELEACKLGSVARRKGVAQVAAHFLREKEYFRQCRDLLSPFLNDIDAEVRAAASEAFRKGRSLDVPDMPSFCRTFVNSKAFEDDPSNLLYAFQEYTRTLLPYSEAILDVVRIFSGPLLEKSQDTSTKVAYDVDLLFAFTSETL